MAMNLTKMVKFVKLMNWYPPFIGAGIRLAKANKDGSRYEVTMKLRWYNKNINGTHFGGSLYAMCDPWYVFIVAAQMGNDYIFWDKSASIKYLKPGKGKVTAIFEIPKEEINKIKEEVDRLGTQTYTFSTYVTGPEGEQVAYVQKEIYLRKKNKKKT